MRRAPSAPKPPRGAAKPSRQPTKRPPRDPVAEPVPLRERLLDVAHALVLERGFAATRVDAILAGAGASKGAFFHHFPSKAALGRALVERYAARDLELLERFAEAAEASSSDPVAQLFAFVEQLAVAAASAGHEPPGCLFVSFIYERGPDGADADAIIRDTIERWRARVRGLLDRAAARRRPALPLDLDALADHVFAVLEGAFILARATADPTRVGAQLALFRQYLELLFAETPRRTKGARRR